MQGGVQALQLPHCEAMSDPLTQYLYEFITTSSFLSRNKDSNGAIRFYCICTSMLSIWCYFRAHVQGSLDSATGLSTGSTHLKQSAQMFPGLNVDVVVKMAPASGIPSDVQTWAPAKVPSFSGCKFGFALFTPA